MKGCNDYIIHYIKYLFGEVFDEEKILEFKTHINSCKNCKKNLLVFYDLFTKNFVPNESYSEEICKNIEVFTDSFYYNNLNLQARENFINHLLVCSDCRNKFIEKVAENIEKNPSPLEHIKNIPEIKFPLDLIKFKELKENEIREVIKAAEASIVVIKSDGGIRSGIKEIIEKRIETLPPLPDNVKKIIQLIEVDADLKEIAKEISKDVSLSARILQIANSPYYRAKFPIEDIQRALSRIGLKSISRIVHIFSLYSSVIKQAGIYLKGYDIPMQSFMNYSSMIAIISMLIAGEWEERTLNMHNFSFEADMIAYTAGLVSNLGMIILNHCIDKPAQNKIKQMLEYKIDLAEIEKTLFSISHSEISARILKKWNLSENFIESILSHHMPFEEIKNKDLLIKIIYPADTIASKFLRPTSKMRPYLNIIEPEERIFEILPFKNKEELENFYLQKLIPTFQEHGIVFNQDTYIQ